MKPYLSKSQIIGLWQTILADESNTDTISNAVARFFKQSNNKNVEKNRGIAFEMVMLLNSFNFSLKKKYLTPLCSKSDDLV